jgi:hypothetical protein
MGKTVGRRLFLAFLLLTVGVTASGVQSPAGAKMLNGIPIPAGVLKPATAPDTPSAEERAPGHLTHPCGGMFTEPPFTGVSPLAIAHVSGFCAGDVYSSPYGDPGVWQADGHNYVVLAGFAYRMFYLFNVDNPYTPVLLRTQPFPSGGTASTSAFAFKQGNNHYVSATMRGSSASGGCGFFVYNVNDPANPQLVGRKTGTDWCTVHEHFVSTDANGDADYAWLAMGSESGSGYKVVVVDIRSLPTMTETGRYQRPDASGGIYVHDVNVVGNRVYLAHWGGGLIIHDKGTLAGSTNPTPLNPTESIRPSGYGVHHAVPTTDGNYVFIEDEFINTSNAEKIKYYDISNISTPMYVGGIRGTGVAATNRAHNLRILPLSPGHDLLLVGWYQAGIKGFEVDTTVSPPTVTEVISHQLLQSTGGQFGNIWGIDYLPCTVRGHATTCLYAGDMKYGLIVDAIGTFPDLDPYMPESQITSPSNGQTINTCSFTVQGNAHDYYSGITGVEVSLDDGATWQAAQGSQNWSYEWNIPADGAYTLRVRGTDAAGNVQVPTTSVSVTVAGGCSSGGTATPTDTPTNTPTNTPANTHTPAPVTNTPTTPPQVTNTPTNTPTACAITFSDVLPTDYFYAAVRYLY